MLTLINPIERAEPFDHADWPFEPKFNGLRAAADTVRAQLISRNGNRLLRFEAVLDPRSASVRLTSRTRRVCGKMR